MSPWQKSKSKKSPCVHSSPIMATCLPWAFDLWLLGHLLTSWPKVPGHLNQTQEWRPHTHSTIQLKHLQVYYLENNATILLPFEATKIPLKHLKTYTKSSPALQALMRLSQLLFLLQGVSRGKHLIKAGHSVLSIRRIDLSRIKGNFKKIFGRWQMTMTFYS